MKKYATDMPLDEPHALWMCLHIFAPFFLTYESGDPRIALALVVLWEIFEWVLLLTHDGTYGPAFADGDPETSWNVWALDIGGGIMGILLALSLQYLSGKSSGDPSFFAPFFRTPTEPFLVRALRFALFVIPTSVFANFGWECAWFESWCEDGYHAFPWGVLLVLPLYALYVWWADLPKLSYVLLAVIFVPVFVPVTKGNEPVPASFVQFILAAGLSTFTFAGCIIHRCQNITKYEEL